MLKFIKPDSVRVILLPVPKNVGLQLFHLLGGKMEYSIFRVMLALHKKGKRTLC